MAYIGNQIRQYSDRVVLDSLTASATADYTLQLNGSNFVPSSAESLTVSLNGVIQKPQDSYTVSSSTLSFNSALSASDSIDFVIAERGITLQTPSAGSVNTEQLANGAVTSAKLASGAVSNQSGFRNIIINGDMSIAQRGTSLSGLTGTNATCDRWRFSATTAGTWTISQSTDVPTGQGFATSFKADCTTANGSLSAGSNLRFTQFAEGQNIQYLKKGTASATSLTMSFWVKSAKTGTYILQIKDRDNSRDISKSYTINSADTWEKKTLTFAGDTTGVFDNDNDWSLEVHFWLAAGTNYTSGTLNTSWNSTTAANIAVGQVNLADNTANDWYVTGVQLEAGTTASDFEFLPVDVNLQRCQRYFELITDGSSQTIGVASCFENGSTGIGHYYVTKRAVPTLYQTTGTNYYSMYRAGTHNYSTQIYLAYASKYTADLYLPIGTTDENYLFLATNASSLIALKSEFF